ncbi:MAG: hypothetical protein PWR03_2212 [Tenuifilum sp.]|jgi:hypothetical protein|nr:hypothetical protein [Tenuifilum sp.]
MRFEKIAKGGFPPFCLIDILIDIPIRKKTCIFASSKNKK